MSPNGPAAMRPLATGANFPLGHKLGRVLWGCAWLVLARWTPPPLHAWRRLVLRAFGARIGAGAQVYASVSIWWPANLEVGEGVQIGPGARLYNQGRIVVGAHSVISQRAHLCASTHDIGDPGFALVLRPIAIGQGCWVAAEAFVGPGVTMHDGSVLGARAALFEDARPFGVYAGNPARLVKERRLVPGGLPG